MYAPRTYETEFGTVTISGDGVSITANGSQLWSWAHRPGSAWPCSTLIDYDELEADFDTNGLLDLRAVFAGVGVDTDDLGSDEFNAWSSDVLRDVVPKNHPVYFVTVGQFS